MNVHSLPIKPRRPAPAAIPSHDSANADEFLQQREDLRQHARVRAVTHDDEWALDERFADLLTSIAWALSLTSAILLAIASIWMLSL